MDKIQLPNHTIEFIKQLIPQREPIIMVDAIFEYEEFNSQKRIDFCRK